MLKPITIKALIFAAVFTAVMSVSFLVEASDVPEGVSGMLITPDEFIGPPAAEAMPIPTIDIPDGMASWYGAKFHGRRTASGRRYNMNEYTAAHKDLPFGTLVRAVNEHTGEAVIVEITDRGPYVKPRVIDLSKAAAKRIGVSVSKVSLKGVTPQYLNAFYLDNDSTVIAITNEMTFVEVPFSALGDLKSASSYASAIKKSGDDNLVVVMLNEKGKPEYFVATPNVATLLASAS